MVVFEVVRDFVVCILSFVVYKGLSWLSKHTYMCMHFNIVS